MYLETFLADFAVFRVFWGISQKCLNFAGPRPREISEALTSRLASKNVFRQNSHGQIETFNLSQTKQCDFLCPVLNLNCCS